MDYKTSIQQLIAFLIRQKLIKDIEEDTMYESKRADFFKK